MQYVNRINIPLFEGFRRHSEIDGRDIPARISGVPLTLKIAASSNTQSRGLMGYDEPSESNGMLFIYDDERILEFWMKNVPYALDIIFFDSQMNLVSATTMEAYNGERDNELPRYTSAGPAKYAVELKSGWINRHLKDDSTLQF